ncbi:hypothetical protein [Ponticoccus alexandrii]|uniref:Restriction endonuclease n=1 Tax=Ponticoccus alexandrii TaxID=1943633 RepID=A0ABX7FCH7_9RHOB|nr:hypothetical protein [Ponticoccus alexandrii]QRF67403.1 hypothetical protein GQA70_14455 [Ponticoccus alexandrii]
MLFSEHFGITMSGEEPWFDPLLSLDTRLYVDPFLIFQNEFGPFVGSHAELTAFYQSAFEIVADAGRDKNLHYWRKAIRILRTPEVAELCLGVTAEGTRGAGAAAGKAKAIASSIYKAVQFGISNPRHFETIQLFEKGIAEDTISDAVGNVLRHRFAAYTKAVCHELGIPTVARPHVRGRYNVDNQRWEQIICHAPLNPFSENQQVFLCPKEYLRPMPSLNPDSFWGYCYDQAAEELRMELGEDISRNVNKDIILEKALQDFESVEEYVKHLEEIGGAPYDLENDPKGVVKWYYATRQFVSENPKVFNFGTQAEFVNFIDEMIATFKNYVENQGGWDLVHNDDGTPKSEAACQRLFLGIVRHYCKANNIDISPEVNIGRGPVDFKLSRGVEFRALIEMKLANNTKFWSGLKKQLPKYLQAEEVKTGRFLIVAFNEKDVKRLNSIYQKIADVAAETSYETKHEVVDAVWRPVSASKL